MSDRIESIDTMRAVAMFFIVIAHVKPFKGFETYGNYVFFALDTIGQFDVPFFFAASGYFLAKTVDANTVTSRLWTVFKKLGSLYLFGILLYLAATTCVALIQDTPVTAALVAHRLGDLSVAGLLYYGDAIGVPLWFLTALFFSICFVVLFVRVGKTRYLVPVAAVLHLLGLIGMNFQHVFEIPFPTRDALFFGFFYVALGFQLRSVDWTPSEDRSHIYLGAVCLFLVTQLLEQYAIGYVLRDHTLPQAVVLTEYTVSTVFFVLALFAYALSNPELGEHTTLPTVGRYAVGIYLVHVPLFRILQAVNRVWGAALGIDLTTTLLWQVAITPLVYVLSLLVYLFMAKIGVIELGGSHTPWLDRIRAYVGSLVSSGRSEIN
ncbi:acyltransferase [Halegenticoccus soli]|uniref:acyltransferase n=1 Tax=Halegenticoccus soli TaxID=1985678 RepID=UPI000C6DDAD1|nr:acyltransferase [Halegenticoccus soli]